MQRNRSDPPDSGRTVKKARNKWGAGDGRHHHHADLEELISCPISLERMRDPVLLVQSGITYDREYLCQSLLHFPAKDPKSNVEYDEKLRYAPNVALRALLTQLHGNKAFEKFDDSSFKTKYEEKWKRFMLEKRERDDDVASDYHLERSVRSVAELLDGRYRYNNRPREMRAGHPSLNVDSDSDAESSDDDESFQPVANNGPREISVVGAGHPSVNGLYFQDGFFAHACRYRRTGRWNNADYIFYIFQCPVSDDTRHWFITIVPYGGTPGTRSDIDFYSSPVTDSCRNLPPQDGWVKAYAGCDPPPAINFVLE